MSENMSKEFMERMKKTDPRKYYEIVCTEILTKMGGMKEEMTIVAAKHGGAKFMSPERFKEFKIDFLRKMADKTNIVVIDEAGMKEEPKERMIFIPENFDIQFEDVGRIKCMPTIVVQDFEKTGKATFLYPKKTDITYE